MQFNTATILTGAALFTSALANYDSYSYGSEVYAREAVPEYEDYESYGLYAREDDSFDLEARDAYFEGWYDGLARRSPTADDKSKAEAKIADAKKEGTAAAESSKKIEELKAKEKPVIERLKKIKAHWEIAKKLLKELRDKESDELKELKKHTEKALSDLKGRSLSHEDLYYYDYDY